MRASRVLFASFAAMIALFYLPFFLQQGYYGFPVPAYRSVPSPALFPYGLIIDLFFLVAIPFIINFIYASNKMNKESRQDKKKPENAKDE